MIARGDETTDVEQPRFGHEFAPGRGEDHCIRDSVSARTWNAERAPRTGRRELGTETFAHDTLETHARADASNGDERDGVGPGGVAAVSCDAARAALPDGDRAEQGEDGLDKGAQRQPRAGLAPDLVADAADEGANDEGEDGTEGLLIGDVEGVVVLAVEEPRDGQCKLGGVAQEVKGTRAADVLVQSYLSGRHTKRISQKRTLHH